MEKRPLFKNICGGGFVEKIASDIEGPVIEFYKHIPVLGAEI